MDLREKSAQQAKAQQHVLGAANFLLLCTRLFKYANNKMVNVHVTNSYIYEFTSFSKLISLPYTLRAKSPSIFSLRRDKSGTSSSFRLTKEDRRGLCSQDISLIESSQSFKGSSKMKSACPLAKPFVVSIKF